MKKKNDKLFAFTKNDTLFLKGIAIFLLLTHHLFYRGVGYIGLNLGGYEVFSILSLLGKVCIGIFVILSGYGLSESFQAKGGSFFSFVYRHLKKIYLNYWLIWLIFVPIGIFFFDRTLEVVYGQRFIWPLIINLFGLQDLFYLYGYNPTWWFITLIVLLYLLFPLFYKLVQRLKIFALVLFAALMYVNFVLDITKYSLLNSLYIYSFSFVLGIYLSQNGVLSSVKAFFADKKSRFIFFPIILILLTLVRVYVQLKFGVLEATKLDGLYGLFIIMFGFQFFSAGWLYAAIAFVGVHSFNIFLFHTFIFSLYFPSFIYWPKYPVLIFALLLGVCLVISILIEKIKSLDFKSFFKPGKSKPFILRKKTL